MFSLLPQPKLPTPPEKFHYLFSTLAVCDLPGMASCLGIPVVSLVLYQIMIDCISYRTRIGSYTSSKSSLTRNKFSSHSNHTTYTQQPSPNPSTFRETQNRMFVSFIYFLYIVYITSIFLSMSVSIGRNLTIPSPSNIVIIPSQTLGTSFLLELLIYLLSLIIHNCRKKFSGPLLVFRILSVIRYRYNSHSSVCYKHFRKYIFWIACSNLFLLTFCNMSLKNPGPPNTLTVLYQNIQGLIPLSELGNESPALNQTKLCELQAYVFSNSPDIIILNETWLKQDIHDNEILPPEAYKVFRCDRTVNSHPPDPNNPNKYRKNGGGVLIAIKSSLDITSKRISTQCAAEVLSIEITLKNNTKFCLSTIYRVGTLGSENLHVLQSYFSSILRSKKFSKLFIIGDLNFPDLSASEWRSGLSSNTSLSSNFLEITNQLGLIQCIGEPTHRHGNILDVLLTNSPQSLTNVVVNEENSFCSSDHFPISFSLKANVRRKQSVKGHLP